MTTEETHRPMTASRWLMGFVVTSSLFCGAIGGLAVLFIGDTFFDKTPDPAVPLTAISADIARAQQRIDEIEHKIQNAATAQTPTADAAALQDEIVALNRKIDTIRTETEKRDIAPALLGLTQLSTAVENDLPLQPGIDALRAAFNHPEAAALLDALAALAREGIPSYADMEKALAALNPAAEPLANDAATADWKTHAKNLLAKFVRVRPTHHVTYEGRFDAAQKAIQSHDLPIARATLIQFPSSPALQNLSAQIERRMQAEKLVRELSVVVTRHLGATAQAATP